MNLSKQTTFPVLSKLPTSVVLREVGPRDGFQTIDKTIPVDLKIKFIESLANAGFSHIQAVSFVHPDRVPQMKDAEQVVLGLKKRPGLTYSGLALNLAGVNRAADAGLETIEISVSASHTHSRKNTGMGKDQALAQAGEMTLAANKRGMNVIAGIQCAFGCAYEGAIKKNCVMDMVKVLLAANPSALCIADTTGMAGPVQIEALMPKILSLSKVPVFLHLHDTRGLGLVNMLIALKSGVRHFDTSFGGLGGCPFIPNAAGNVSSEEALYLMSGLGVKTGIDLEQVAACSRKMENFLGVPLPGKVHNL